MTEKRARVFLPINLLIAIIAVSTASLFIRFTQARAVETSTFAVICGGTAILVGIYFTSK